MQLQKHVPLGSQFYYGIFSPKKKLETLFFVATSTEISNQFYDTPSFVDSIRNKIGECVIYIYIYLYFATQIAPYLL
jgi:hypothetical protein